MTRKDFDKFKSSKRNYLSNDILRIEINHVDETNLYVTCNGRKEQLYEVRHHCGFIRNYKYYMTEHDILESFKSDDFKLEQYQEGD